MLGGTASAQLAFFEVARSGSPAELRAALAAGANVNVLDEYGQTPLFYAAEYNSPEVVESLVRAGADVNARTPDGWTPLMVAFRNTAHPQVASRLFNLGARADAVRYETYANDALGYSLVYPAGILEPQGELGGGDGQSFLSRDGRARMLVFSLPGGSQSLADLYALESADTPSRTVTYQVLRDGWFVVSGYEDDEVFYQKTLLAGERLITAELKYHRQLQAVFSAITSQISWSFSLTPVRAPAPAQAATSPAPRASTTPAPEETPRPPPSPAQTPGPASQPDTPPLEVTPPAMATAPEQTDTPPLTPEPAPPREEPAPTSPPIPTPAPAPAPPRETAARFFDEAFRLAGVREVSCSDTVMADAAPGGLEVRCGRKHQDAVGFKGTWDRAAAGFTALEAVSPWQIAGGSHWRDYQQDESRMTVIFNDGYIINAAEVILYRRPGP
jgi:hypothetical protein